MNTLIPITNLFETHKISRETILAEAIQGEVQLFCIERGEPRELQPEELKSLPHPEEQFRKPSESRPAQRFFGIVDNHTRLLRMTKSLSVREEDLQEYISKKQKTAAKQRKSNSALTKKINNLERVIGALIVANYSDCHTKNNKYKIAPIQEKLAEQLSWLSVQAPMEQLRKNTFPNAIKAFLTQQKTTEESVIEAFEAGRGKNIK